MKHALLALLLLGAASQPARAGDPAALSNSLVHIGVTFQAHNPRMPWQKGRPEFRSGYGIAVGDGLLLTTEALVRNQTLVEVRRAGSGRSTPARVVEADSQVNLALIRPEGPGPEWSLTPIPISPDYAKPGARLRVVQFDDGDRIQDGQASVVHLMVQPLPDGPGALLAPGVLTEINVDGPGAPALDDGRLAGVFMTYDSAARTGVIIPAPLIARFVDDVRQPPYDGIASAGFSWTALLDPAKRRSLGAEPDGGGILILQTFAGSPAAAVLKARDVLAEWDGVALDNQGYYADPDLGRVLFTHLISGSRRPGEDVPVTVIRGGRALGLQVQLRRRRDADALIPENVEGAPPDYLVEGGFVIRELTGDYLRAQGGDWPMRSDTRLTHLYYTKALDGDGRGGRIVILSAVLPDPLNAGYHEYRDTVIEQANGRPVSNMGDVFRIRDEDGLVSRIRLRGLGIDLVLDKDLLPQANDRIARTYRIGSLMRRTAAPAPSAAR